MEEEKKDQADKVLVDRKMLDGILSRVDMLEKEKAGLEESTGMYPAGRWETDKSEERKLTATILKWRKKASDKFEYVVDWKFDRIEFNPVTREKDLKYFVTLLDKEDKKRELEVIWPEFLGQVGREKVELVKKRVKKLKQVTGSTRVSIVDYTKFRTRKGSPVDMVVTMDKITYDVKLESGKILTLEERLLNA